MWAHFNIPESLSFLEKGELSRIGVIWLNPSIEKSFNYFSSLKVLFENQLLLSFFLATRLWKQDNDWYLKALHLGNEGHQALTLSKPRGRLEVLIQ